MKNHELVQLHKQITEQVTTLNRVYADLNNSISIDEEIKAVSDLENQANMFRIVAEKLATGTRKLYAGEED